MKFINKLRWNHYVILTILFIFAIVVMFFAIDPLNTGSADDTVTSAVTTTTTDGQETTTTSTVGISVVTMPITTTSTTDTTSSTTTSITVVTTNQIQTETTAVVEDEFVEVEKSVEPVVTTEEVTSTTTQTDTTVATTATTTIETASTVTSEYVVYKPTTYYIHRSSCHWVDNSCIKITDTNGIQCRRCSECNPDMVIVTEYIPPTPTIADSDRQMLAEIVWHEAGSSWISQYNKAKIAAGVMNRVNDSRFPGTVYGVLTQPGQFTGYWPGCCTPTQACYDAVDYYFNHTSEFNGDNSWWGDGSQNHFYYQ